VQDQDFAIELEALRLSAELSLRDLERATGIPRSTLGDALAGRRAPRLKTTLAIVRACNADPEPWRFRWLEMTRQHASSPAEAPSSEPGGSVVPSRLAPIADLVPAPAQLPGDVADFAGRERELSLLGRSGVTLIHGQAGVGKTALAVHWARTVIGRFPDGQLFMDLRGHHPTIGPMPAAEAMARMLSALGVQWTPTTRDPNDDEGARLWRSALAGRRLLIVLDDAVSVEQVRPLMPGDVSCAMLITSRHYLADLVVRDGVNGVVLDVLPPSNSTALLASVIGEDRVGAEPEAAAAVAAACGHLPLALRLAGAMLAGAPEYRVADLERDFSQEDRLTALEGLVRPSAVEDAFELSYEALPASAAFLFQRLALHPGPDISVAVAELLAGRDEAYARSALHALSEAHMIEPVRPGVYRMHDLLQDYASRRARIATPVSEHRYTRARLLAWYTDRVLAVAASLGRGYERVWVDEAERSTWQPTEEDAWAWLETEHRNIAAVIEYDACHGDGRHAWFLVDLITQVLFRRKDATVLLAAIDSGLKAAVRMNDRRAQAAMYHWRGWMRRSSEQALAAAADFARARELFHTVGAQRAEAAALRGMAVCAAETARLDEARRYGEEALAIYRTEDDLDGQARAWQGLAIWSFRSADFAAAEAFLRSSLALHEAAGNCGGAAQTLGSLANICVIRGELKQALTCSAEAATLAREISDTTGEIAALISGARASLQAGGVEEARQYAGDAVALTYEVGFPLLEAFALSALASALRGIDPGKSAALRTRAISIAVDSGDLLTQAEIMVYVAGDIYADSAEASYEDRNAALRVAREAAQRAFDAGQSGDGPHLQAEALTLLAACDLGLGKLADAVGEARRAIEMHTASGARASEAAARCVLAQALAQDDDPGGAAAQRRAARRIGDDLDLPATAPLRTLLQHPLG
jgi:tetratricopeptide (TPR) repeat protein/transcriptional regulator with XRE-family HTH domain